MKDWKDLTISDDYMFKLIIKRKRICKQMLERILHIEIEDLSYVGTEKVLIPVYGSKGVRMDVYVKDGKGTIYNIEMQVRKPEGDGLAKRTRYYQAMIDMDLIGKGVYYDQLRQTYIIFVCTFDLFGLEQRIYTFRNTCVELPELELGDGATKIFLNAKGLKGAVDADLEGFLRYVNGKVAQGQFAEALAKEVERVKIQKEARREYMTLYMQYQQYHRDGLEAGRREGMREGRREGLREGRREGLREGRREGVLDMARSLLALNVPIDVIEQSSGMTRAEILALQETASEQGERIV